MQEIRRLSKKEGSDRRRELLKDLSGNAFFFRSSCGQKKCKLCSGRSPWGTRKLLSRRYSSSVMAVLRYCLQCGFCWRNIGPNRHKIKAQKRARQINFVGIVNNADSQNSKWFHFDIDYNKLFHLNRKPKQKRELILPDDRTPQRPR